MDYVLKCNTLSCRRELDRSAVVTTCSHIFCEECANRFNLTNPNNTFKTCPACDQQLLNADDVVLSNLNPSDDYKTSILSGLSPNTIMECAGRALNFWAYQTSQEILYQGMQAKALTDRYSKLKGQMDSIIREANEEMSMLRENLNNSVAECSKLKHRNQDLQRTLAQKGKDQAKLQELFDRARGRGQREHIEQAAESAVDRTILESAAPTRYIDHYGNVTNQQSQMHTMPMAPPPIQRTVNSSANRAHPISGWNGISSQESNTSRISQTPSHRQRLNTGPNLGLGGSNGHGLHLGTPALPRVSPGRGQNANGFAGYGMSAGLKVSQTPIQGHRMQARPGSGPRVAQRPASTPFAGGTRAFGGGQGYTSGREFY